MAFSPQDPSYQSDPEKYDEAIKEHSSNVSRLFKDQASVIGESAEQLLEVGALDFRVVMSRC